MDRQPYAAWTPRVQQNLRDLKDISSHITTALLAVVDDPARADATAQAVPDAAIQAGADAAIQAGADMLDLGCASPETVARIRGRHPDTLIAGHAHTADVVRDAATARRTGAGLICAGLPDATAALRAGVPRDAIIVAIPPALAGEATAAGWAVLAEVDEALPRAPGVAAVPSGTEADGCAHPAATEAAAAVCAWLGVPVVRTRHVTHVRRALDMTASIMGTRPPAWTLRGLA